MRRLPLLLCPLMSACSGAGLTIAMVQQNNSGQDGTATLTDTRAGLEIVVRIKPSNIGGSQTSHVHQGRCDNVGAIASSLKMMQLEVSHKDGVSTVENEHVVFRATLEGETLGRLRSAPHVINVHDARDPSLYVSCGEID